MHMDKAPSRRRKAFYFGTAASVTAATVIFGAGPAWAAPEAATISPAVGPTGGGNSVTITTTSPAVANYFIQGSTVVTFEGATSCSASPIATANQKVTGANVRVIANNKLALTVPAGVVTGSGASAGNVYSVCVYDGSNNLIASKLSGASAYTVGATPAVTSYSPAAGPSQGGGTLMITGTAGLDTANVTIGGTTVTPSTQTTTSFVGTIPARSPGTYPLVISNPVGGSVTYATGFTYSNGVTVVPNTAPNTQTRTDISVTGVGFASMTFSTTNGQTPNDSNGHVYLVKGAYDPTKNGLVKTNGQTTECLNVLPISNTELICSLYLAGGGVPLSSPRSVSGTVAGSTLTATAGNFGPGDVGEAVTGSASIPVGTYITAVTDPQHVTLSKAATSAITSATTLALGTGRTFTDATLTSGQPTITSTSGAQFSSADVGRTISGTGITGGTTILSVQSATSATMSANATATASGTYTIGYTAPLTPVPNGTYTVTVVSNGGLDVQPGGTNATPSYNASIISSGSTFTVADY